MPDPHHYVREDKIWWECKHCPARVAYDPNTDSGWPASPVVEMGPLSPQERVKCACPGWSSARACVDARYGKRDLEDDRDDNEDCSCVCHQSDDEDFDEEEDAAS